MVWFLHASFAPVQLQFLFPDFGLRLEHELMQEKFAQQEHEDWRRDVASRLMQIRQKPRLMLGQESYNTRMVFRRTQLPRFEGFERIRCVYMMCLLGL